MNENLTAMAAIEELYRTHQQSVQRYLHHIVFDPETAEDLCHETFVKALRCWSQLSAMSRAEPWLFRIARNTAFDHLRRCRQIKTTTLDEEHAVQAEACTSLEHLENTGPIWEALRQLPEHYRLPLLQSAGGYAPTAIAAQLGCNTATLRSRLRRARARFRTLYMQHSGAARE